MTRFQADSIIFFKIKPGRCPTLTDFGSKDTCFTINHSSNDIKRGRTDNEMDKFWSTVRQMVFPLSVINTHVPNSQTSNSSFIMTMQ